MEGYFCKRCGEKFPSARARKFCPKCAKEQGKARKKLWLCTEAGKAYLQRKNQKRLSLKAVYEEVPDLSHLKEVEPDLKVHYCANYDPANITCINCYADTTAQYRGCYGRIK